MKKKWSIGKFLLTVAGMTLISQAVHSMAAIMEMGYYKDPQYFPVWSKLMMPGAGPPPTSFFLYSMGLGLVEWGFFLAVFIVIGGGIPAQGRLVKGLYYGVVVFLVGTLGQSLGLGLIVNLPYGLLFLWTLESLVIDLLNGALAGRLES
jgi:hypothetical protein